MDVIIRTSSGKHYQLSGLSKPSITLDDNLLFSHEQLLALLSSASPQNPKNWLDVWRKLKPANGKTYSSNDEVLKAITDLARQQRLQVKLVDHNAASKGSNNQGASHGSTKKQQPPPEKAMLGPELQAKPAAPLNHAPSPQKFAEASAAKSSTPPENA